MATPWEERPIDECRSCKEDIKWVTWPASQKRMPVDAEPSSAGDVAVDTEGMARRVGQGYTGPKYTSHFATCPNAEEHRNR